MPEHAGPMEFLDRLDPDHVRRLLDAGSFFWLDLVDPEPATLDEAGRLLGLHPLAVEDSREFGQRPKLDDYGGVLLLVFYGLHEGELAEVHLHLSGRWMLTVHHGACDPIEAAHQRLNTGRPRTEEEAIYRVLDGLTDSFFPTLEAIEDQLEELEDAILDGSSPDPRERLFTLRRRLARLRRVIGPQRDVLATGGTVVEALPGLESDSAHDYFRDVYDHLIRIADEIDTARDRLSGALELHLAAQDHRMNEVMKQLTVVATIFLPLTFVTGFFGQNFAWLTGHIDHVWEFVGFGVGGLVLPVAIMVWWFWRSGFIGGR